MLRVSIVAVLAVLFLLAACGDDAGDGPAATPTGPADDPASAVFNVEGLRAQAAELDGQMVHVRSNYWSNAEGQYLSDILMESYPPQIPFDRAVILDGDMPESVLALLDHADDVSPAVIWGEVDITGTVHVDGDDVRLEIEEVFVVQA